MPATVAYTYLGLNTPVRADYEDPDVRWDLITGSSPNPYAGLDRFGRTIDCRWEKYSATAADLARLKYGYNRASSRQWRDDTVGTGFDEFYTYDAVQRLIDMERGTLTGGPPPTGITSPTLGQEWDLDPTGNWSGFEQTLSGAVTQTRTSNMDNEITNINNSVGSSWVTPVYNNAGAITLMPSAGATPTPGRTATYDAWDRTTRIAGGVTGTGDYRYDGLNRRTTKATLSPNETRHFYYSDQWQVLEERVGSSTDAERQHVWGLRYVDDLALRDRDTNGDGSLDERLYSMQDDNWNVVAICNPSAVVQERYAYTPYGMIQFLNASFGAISTSAFAWRYLFTGRERDVESTLQYNRNRYYHARLSTWTTRDPMGYQAGDVNLYRYAATLPTSRLDPNGRFCIGLGLGVGFTLFLGLPVTGIPGGISASANCQKYLCFFPTCTDFCCTAQLAYLLGIGLAANAGVSFVFSLGPAPSSGPSGSIGVSGGVPSVAPFFVLDGTLEIDSNGSASLTVPTKIGVGNQLYVALRFGYNCTGCCGSITNINTCRSQLWACLKSTAQTLSGALSALASGKTVQPGAKNIIYQGGPIPNASGD